VLYKVKVAMRVMKITGVITIISKGSKHLENDRNIRINDYFYIFIYNKVIFKELQVELI
jgi:hypothetical protein